MTISSLENKSPLYSGPGSGPFPFPMKVFSKADLYVIRANSYGTESTLVVDSDYTASINPDQDVSPGGSITLSVALGASDTLVIARNVLAYQGVDLINAGPFHASVIENALDKLTILHQQNADEVYRSLKFAITTPSGVDPYLPSPVPYSLIGWNGDGNGFVNADPTYSSVLAIDLADSAGSSLIGNIVSGTGAISRTVQSKLRDMVSVKDFGAVGDGVADDTVEIQAAFDSGATAVLFPAGTYLVTGIVNSAVKTVFAGHGVKLKFNTGATPAPVFRLTCDTFSLVGGLTIDGNSTATTGFYDEGANNFDINSLYITGCTGDGVRCYAVTGNGTYYSTFRNLVSKNNGGNGVSVETLNSGEASIISLTAPGSGYSDGEQTASGGTGSGLKVTVTTSAGAIVSAYVSDNGLGYTVGDVCTVSGGTGGQVTVTATGVARANVLNFVGGQVSANGGDGFNLNTVKGICTTGVSTETNTGYAYRVTNCQNQALTVLGGWVEGNTTGGVTMDLASRGVQFYGTRFNQSNPFAGTGINNVGNCFLVDDLSGVLTKAMELIGASLRSAYLRDALNDALQSAGSNTLQCKASGDAYYRYQLLNNGGQYWGSGAAPSDNNMIRTAAGMKFSGKLMATGGLGVGNSAAATTPGSVTKKIQVFDDTGASIGYLAVYGTIT